MTAPTITDTILVTAAQQSQEATDNVNSKSNLTPVVAASSVGGLALTGVVGALAYRYFSATGGCYRR